jgi:hypothetical protein
VRDSFLSLLFSLFSTDYLAFLSFLSSMTIQSPADEDDYVVLRLLLLSWLQLLHLPGNVALGIGKVVDSGIVRGSLGHSGDATQWRTFWSNGQEFVAVDLPGKWRVKIWN